MRDLRRNQVDFTYELLSTHANENSGEKYTDSNGNTYDLLDGSESLTYDSPIEFKASYQESGRNADFQPYGLDKSEYQLIISTTKELPITETSKITRLETETEYQVVKIVRSLNETKYVLKEIVKWSKEQQLHLK